MMPGFIPFMVLSQSRDCSVPRNKYYTWFCQVLGDGEDGGQNVFLGRIFLDLKPWLLEKTYKPHFQQNGKLKSFFKGN